MSFRYLSRHSKGIVILSQAEETYVHEDGEHSGPASQLDMGGECNKLMDRIEHLHNEILRLAPLNQEALSDSLKAKVVSYQNTLDSFVAEHEPVVDPETVEKPPTAPFDPFNL